MSRYDEVAQQLTSGAFELFTCDVFDTLLYRPTARPTDVFVDLARSLSASGVLAPDIDPIEFSGARQAAERHARHLLRVELDSPESTLAEIWTQVPKALLHGAPIEDLVAAELDCEGRHLRVHAGAARLLAVAHDRGITTALVSDSYLSSDQLGRLVAAAGVDLSTIDRIVTSSERRLGKGDGLLAVVIADLGIEPSRTLHFGDNLVADLAAAADAGATGLLAEIAPDRRAIARPSAAVVSYADRTGTDGAIGAAVRETLLSADLDADSAAYQFGVGVVGPALAGFSSWASSTAEDRRAGVVHCLLREGAVIAELMRITRPIGPEPRLVHASRWAMVRAAVFDASEAEIMAAVERRTRFRAEHLASAFDLDLAEVVAVVGDQPYHHHRRPEAISAIADDESLSAQIVAASALQRVNVLSYLERTLDPAALAGDTPLVVCDIGWGGKIQSTIDAILRSVGYTGEIVGLYLMLSETGVRRRRSGESLLSYLPETFGSADVGAAATIVQKHAAIIERVATPELGTLLGFTDDGEPVCRSVDDDAQVPSLLRARRGVYDVTTTLAAIGSLDATTWHDPQFRAALLESIADTIAAPSALLSAELAEWQHDDLAGDDPETLVAGGIAALGKYVNPADADGVGWDEIFWLPGLAAASNPALSAQLAAVRLGVDADALAPLSETGHARIASFPVGSALASHQVEGVPHRSAEGWQLLRLHTAVPSLRSLRLDAGDAALLVQNGTLTVTLTTDSGVVELGIDGLTDSRLRWIDGRPLSDSIGAFEQGGHLLIELESLSGINRVDVDWAFRTWPLADDDRRLARPSPVARSMSTGRQLAVWLRRIIRRPRA